MNLDRLTIRGYKSIRNLENFELRCRNVLIGADGAGKSNFISLFRLVAAIADENLQIFVRKHGGAHALLFEGGKRTLEISADFRFGLNDMLLNSSLRTATAFSSILKRYDSLPVRHLKNLRSKDPRTKKRN